MMHKRVKRLDLSGAAARLGCFRHLLIGAVAAAELFSSVLTTKAYTYAQVGIESNFLIDSGRVIFIQADGSLTALKLETGEVLKRGNESNFGGDLERVPAGILNLAYGRITMLNADTLVPIWETASHYSPNVIEGKLVSYDGNGLVECHELATGKVLWLYNLPGALEVVAANRRVLVHRAAMYENAATTTALLDLVNGKELFRKEPPPGVQWAEAFFDGTNCYLMAGPYSGKKASYKPTEFATLNLRGDETAALPIPRDGSALARKDDGSFEVDGQIFAKGRVYPDRKSIPKSLRMGEATYRRETNGVMDTVETEYDLKEGVAWVERVKSGPTPGSKPVYEFEVRNGEARWVGTSAYLGHGAVACALAQTNGKVLLGDNLGHVECIDSKTGVSLWLYVFPTIRHTMSFSGRGMPPMMATAAAIYRQENSNVPRAGFQVTDGRRSESRVILDPKPMNPYRQLPMLLSICWSVVVIAGAGLVGFHFHPKAKGICPTRLGTFSVCLVVLALLCFFNLGRVSVSSYAGLVAVILGGVVFGVVDAVRCYRAGRWVWGTVYSGVFGMVALLILGLWFPIF